MKKVLDKHLWVKKVILVVIAYLCVLSVGKIMALHGDINIYWGGKYFGYNIWSVVLFGIDIWLMQRFFQQENNRLRVFSLIGGWLLAMALVYGAYAHFVNDIFLSVKETFLQIGMVACITPLISALLMELFLWLERGNEWYHKQKESEKTISALGYFGIVWLMIFLAYVPLFLAWWPGNFIYDARFQLQNVIEGYYNTHHPLIHTLMMGKAYEFGQRIGNVSAGYQIYTLLQMLILSSSFAYLLLYLYRRKVPRCIRVCTFLWFALFPMHALFAISSTKDVICAAFFLYFMVFLMRLVKDGEAFKWYSYAGMIGTGGMLSLFRNNALYAVLVTGILLVLCMKGLKNKRNLILIFISVFIFAKLFNYGLIQYTNAKTDDQYRESFSVPLQCLARICAYRGEEVPQEIYDEICQYIREGDIAGYNPYLADGIKNEANEAQLKGNTWNFFKLWLKAGLLFPDEYIESVITNTLGYWYPYDQGIYVSADIALYHTLIGMGEEIEKKDYFPPVNDMYSELFWTNEYHYVPILGYFFRNAPYVWLVILSLLWTFYKKEQKSTLVGILPFMYLGTCLFGPMAALRYIYSIVVCAPLLIDMMLSHKEES